MAGLVVAWEHRTLAWWQSQVAAMMSLMFSTPIIKHGGGRVLDDLA